MIEYFEKQWKGFSRSSKWMIVGFAAFAIANMLFMVAFSLFPIAWQESVVALIDAVDGSSEIKVFNLWLASIVKVLLFFVIGSLTFIILTKIVIRLNKMIFGNLKKSSTPLRIAILVPELILICFAVYVVVTNQVTHQFIEKAASLCNLC